MTELLNFHAVIVEGGDESLRQMKIASILEAWKVSSFDKTIIREEPSTGILAVKKAISSLKLAPYNSPFTVLVFPQAELLTLEAQQSLLKTLEEPPSPRARIILSLERSDLLLPTITSRCRITKTESTQKEKFFAPREISQLLGASPGKLMALVAPYGENKQKAALFLKQFSKYLTDFSGGENGEEKLDLILRLKLMKNTLKAVKMLGANITPGTCLETVFLDI